MASMSMVVSWISKACCRHRTWRKVDINVIVWRFIVRIGITLGKKRLIFDLGTWTFTKVVEKVHIQNGINLLKRMLTIHFESMMFRKLGKVYPTLTLGWKFWEMGSFSKQARILNKNFHIMPSFAIGVEFCIWNCFWCNV